MDENNVNQTAETVEAAQTVASSSESDFQNPELVNTQAENVIAGIVGAFLFSLVGGVLWFVLYQVGFIAGISAMVGVIAAMKGYEVFAKKMGLRGIIISAAIAVVVIIIAHYLCLSAGFMNAWNEYIPGNPISLFDAVRMVPDTLSDPDVAAPFFTDLAIGLVFSVLCCIQPIREAVANAKTQQK